MGIIQHHAVIATSFTSKAVSQVLDAIDKLPEEDRNFFLVHTKAINGYKTVILVPDGSKEGWEASNKGDARRKWFRNLLKEIRHFSYIEISFGELGACIEQTNVVSEY